MRNNFFYLSVLIYLTFTSNLVSQELKITSSEVQYDNINKITVFKGGVSSTDQKGNKLFSEYIKYYFSLICITPIRQNKPITIIGIHTDKIKPIFPVSPNAIDKSLK